MDRSLARSSRGTIPKVGSSSAESSKGALRIYICIVLCYYEFTGRRIRVR